jgi:hypothetical protein
MMQRPSATIIGELRNPRGTLSHALRIVALVAVTVTASCLPAGTASRPQSVSQAEATRDAPPPAPAPVLQPIPAAEALAINAAIPLSTAPNPAAAPLVVHARSGTDQLRALDCLADAIYYEARSESEDGQRAVAQVVLNRVRHPAFPNSVCAVVYQGAERGSGCQFTFACDGSLAIPPLGAAWLRARRIASAALAGDVYAPVGNATHYHTQAVLPVWSQTMVKAAVIGAHIFYRWNNHWGEPGAYVARYAGAEPALAMAARQTTLARARATALAAASAPLPIVQPLPGSALPAALPAAPAAPQKSEADTTILEPYRNSGSIRSEWLHSGRIKDSAAN